MSEVYRIYFRRVPKRGIRIIADFAGIGNSRHIGLLDGGRFYSSDSAAVKYAKKYSRNYPKKDIEWIIDVSTLEAANE